MDIRKELKNDFKNYISEDLKIYYSKSRPVMEVLMFLPVPIKIDLKTEIWTKNPHFLITYEEIDKHILNDLELKEFDFNFMEINHRDIKLNIEMIFDILGYNINEILEHYKTDIKYIYSLFSKWDNVQDLFNIANKFINEYWNKKEVA